MKKILCLIGQLRGGGTEKQLYLFLKHLDKTHYAPIVVVSGEASGKWYEPIRQLNVPILGLGNPSILLKIFKFRDIILEHKPSLIFSWSFFTNIYKLAAPSIPFISSLRGDLNSAKKNIGNFFWRLCILPSNFVVNSEHLKKQLIAHGISNGKIHLIENIFDHELIPKDENDRKKIRARYKIPEEAKVIVGSGRDTYEKNLDLFLDVFCELKRKNNNWYAFVIGDCVASFQQRINKMGVQNSFFLPGEIKNPFEFYRASDIFFLSSRTEGMPNALIEALACGCKAVAMETGGVANFAKKCLKDGFLIFKQGESPSVISQAIDDLSKNVLNSECKRLVEDYFHPSKQMKKYCELIEKVSFFEQFYV